VVTLVGHTAPAHALAWSPDGQQLATAGEDLTILVWDAQSHRTVRRLGTCAAVMDICEGIGLTRDKGTTKYHLQTSRKGRWGRGAWAGQEGWTGLTYVDTPYLKRRRNVAHERIRVANILPGQGKQAAETRLAQLQVPTGP
jgi:WD40 repeat protein